MGSKRLLYLLIVMSGIVACNSNDRKFSIIGSISGLPKQTVMLEQLNANDVITIVDSEKSNGDGHFEMSGISPEPGLYRLHFKPNKFILLSIDKGTIKIVGDWNHLETYTVGGSAGSENLKGFVTAIREHLRDFNTMSLVLDTLQLRGNDSILNVAKKDFSDMKLQFTQFVEHYADTTSFEPNAIFAVRILNPASENIYLSAFSQTLSKRFPNSRMTHDFGEYYTKATARTRHAKQPESPETGNVAPDLNMPGVDDKMVALSSLKGKYVLLDFWASWCGPCRAENPNVVAAYQKFKGRNFTVYGVSLDNKKEAWLKAIKDDGLTWTQVSDLKGWSSTAATLYSVQSIPTNFLIDPSGKIIAHNLRGEQLEQTLEKVLKPANP